MGATLTARVQNVADELEVLSRVKAPYARQAMIIRSAKIPKALYGCEVAPANEGSLQQMRARVAKTLTYTTEHMSADMTFATCSHGPDLDPDIRIITRGAVAFRRYYTRKPGGATSRLAEVSKGSTHNVSGEDYGVADGRADGRSLGHTATT